MGQRHCDRAASLQVLWLTTQPPSLPLNNGALIYSANLLRGTAELGASVEVICRNSEPGRRSEPALASNIAWNVVRERSPPIIRRLLSSLPASAAGYSTRSYAAAVESALRSRRWDAVVIDGIWTGGYAAAVMACTNGIRPALIYLAHNHQSSMSALIARRHHGSRLLRFAMWLDAVKTAWLEARLTSACDLVVAITQEDADRFRQQRPHGPIITVYPGHSRQTAAVPHFAQRKRRLLILGSFHWIVKRANLEQFLSVAAQRAHDANVEVYVVGAMAPDYQRKLSKRFPTAVIVGPVEDFAPELAAARFGLVIDDCGGGFKLKVLDYAFGGVTIAGLRSAMLGTSLREGTHFLGADDCQSLIEKIITHIDDYDSMSQLSQRALARFQSSTFDWHTSAGALVSGIVNAVRAKGGGEATSSRARTKPAPPPFPQSAQEDQRAFSVSCDEASIEQTPDAPSNVTRK